MLQCIISYFTFTGNVIIIKIRNLEAIKLLALPLPENWFHNQACAVVNSKQVILHSMSSSVQRLYYLYAFCSYVVLQQFLHPFTHQPHYCSYKQHSKQQAVCPSATAYDNTLMIQLPRNGHWQTMHSESDHHQSKNAIAGQVGKCIMNKLSSWYKNSYSDASKLYPPYVLFWSTCQSHDKGHQVCFSIVSTLVLWDAF